MTTTTGKLIGMIKLVLLVSGVLTLAACGPRREKNQKNETRRGGRLLSRIRTILWFRELKIKFISVLRKRSWPPRIWPASCSPAGTPPRRSDC